MTLSQRDLLVQKNLFLFYSVTHFCTASSSSGTIHWSPSHCESSIKFSLSPSVPQKTLCETLLVSAKLLSYPYNVWSVIFLWIVIFTLPSFAAAQILFIYPMNTPQTDPPSFLHLAWRTEFLPSEWHGHSTGQKGKSNMYPSVTGWLWKRLSIQQ